MEDGLLFLHFDNAWCFQFEFCNCFFFFNFEIRRHCTQTFILSWCSQAFSINLIKSNTVVTLCLVRMCHCFTLTSSIYQKYCSSVWLAVQLSVLSGLNNCCNTENKWIHTSPVERTDPYSHFYLVCRHLVSDYLTQHQKIKLYSNWTQIHPFSNITQHTQHRTEHNTTRRFRHIREKRYELLRRRHTTSFSMKTTHAQQDVRL